MRTMETRIDAVQRDMDARSLTAFDRAAQVHEQSLNVAPGDSVVTSLVGSTSYRATI